MERDALSFGTLSILYLLVLSGTLPRPEILRKDGTLLCSDILLATRLTRTVRTLHFLGSLKLFEILQ